MDILLLTSYTPPLVIGIYNSATYGHRSYPEWKYIALLSFFRIIAAGTGIGAATSTPTDTTLLAVSLTFSNIGTTLLVACLLGLTTRIDSHLQGRGIGWLYTRLAHVVIVVALLLNIIAANFQATSNVGSGHRLTGVSSTVLLWPVFGLALLICCKAFAARHYTSESIAGLNLLSLASTPFLFVRLLYASCSAFRPDDANFSYPSANITAVILRALMGILMEWGIVAIYLGALATYQNANIEAGETAWRSSDDTARTKTHQACEH